MFVFGCGATVSEVPDDSTGGGDSGGTGANVSSSCPALIVGEADGQYLFTLSMTLNPGLPFLCGDGQIAERESGPDRGRHVGGRERLHREVDPQVVGARSGRERGVEALSVRFASARVPPRLRGGAQARVSHSFKGAD